jgi:ribose transport system ATP-binding protein
MGSAFDTAVLRTDQIRKSFPGVVALDRVDFDVRRGEVHALLGENGAGKSTLIKILTGAYTKDSGTTYLDGKEVNFPDPHTARISGISVVYQELTLFPELDVGKNIFMGREFVKWGRVDWGRVYAETANYLKLTNSPLNPHALVKTLGVADQQTIEITRALSLQCKVLILDEPTSSLSDRETEILFRNIEKLKASGTGIIFITHKLDEVEKVADRVTVLRDGRKVGTLSRDQIHPEILIQMMVGREIVQKFPEKPEIPDGEPILAVSNLCRGDVLRNISFVLRSGEILGISGLVGSGRTELVRCLVGADPKDSGTVKVDGRTVDIKSPRIALKNGIGLVPEDRRYQGLVVIRTVLENIAYTILDKLAPFGVMKWRLATSVASKYIDKLSIRTPGLDQQVLFLSGGNQQKIVLAKWLAAQCRIIILDEPTRGIDVGAKVEIYQLLVELAKQRVGIIMVSSELPEIIGMSHRVLVLHRGTLAGEVSGNEMNAEKICSLSMGKEEREKNGQWAR